MKIRIMENERKFDEAAAWIIIGQMLKKPDSVIGLSTGNTTGNMHAIVSQLYELHPFDTSQVTDMHSMFYKCASLAEADVGSFDTSRVTDMAVMFYECGNLTELDVSGFDTSQVTRMTAMF